MMMENLTHRPLLWLATVFASFLFSNNASAETFDSTKPLHPFHACVWDPLGKSGPGEQIMREARAVAFRWGIDLNFSVYSDERIAIDEFKLGRCDGVNMLGFRAREFNTLTGSLGAIGAIPSYEHLGVIIKSLSSKKAAPLMRVGEFEVTGIGPAGAIFMFTRDRSILQPKEFAGLRMAVLDDIPESSYLSEKYGITPVSSSIFNSFLKFNNGSVDLTAGPAIVYEPFELYKGLEPNGGIYAEPFLYISMQLIARWSALPDGIPQKTREYVLSRYKEFVDFLKKPEETIPDKYWIDIPPHLYDFWEEDFRQSRLDLGKLGIYDQRALKLMRKVRCKLDPGKAECSASVRE
jgi:hypothetical protein